MPAVSLKFSTYPTFALARSARYPAFFSSSKVRSRYSFTGRRFICLIFLMIHFCRSDTTTGVKNQRKVDFLCWASVPDNERPASPPPNYVGLVSAEESERTMPHWPRLLQVEDHCPHNLTVLHATYLPIEALLLGKGRPHLQPQARTSMACARPACGSSAT